MTSLPAPRRHLNSEKQCINEDGRPVCRRGRCRRCYEAWRRETPKAERPIPSIEERFWAKVDKSGGPRACWPWTAGVSDGGYGRFYVDPERGVVSALAFAIELTVDVQCPPGKEGCHHCDNPPCCNPTHGYYGTRRQNVDDMIDRDRVLRGEQRHNAVLTEADVIRIRERCALGELPEVLAIEYGVRPSTLRLIECGHRWAHVGGPIRTVRVRRNAPKETM